MQDQIRRLLLRKIQMQSPVIQMTLFSGGS